MLCNFNIRIFYQDKNVPDSNCDICLWQYCLWINNALFVTCVPIKTYKAAKKYSINFYSNYCVNLRNILVVKTNIL